MISQQAPACNFKSFPVPHFSNAIVRDERLSPRAKALAFALASVGDGEPVSPRTEDLLRWCGIHSRPTLRLARYELEKFGYVTVERDSGGRITLYTLHTPSAGGAA